MLDIYLPLLYLYVVQGVLSSNTDCTDTVYMKIPYNELLINRYSNVVTSVISAYKCLELCRDDVLCKSVGIDTSSMACYLYDGRVYAGLSGTVNTDMVYYWQLEAECPLHLDYSEDPTSKICSKRYVNYIVNWTYAQVKCEMDGGHLFLADTPAKLSASETIVFVGATDILEEGVWNWLNGVTVNGNLFTPGQPSNGGDGEHCLSTTHLNDKFNDVSCQSKHNFLCEVPTNKAFNQ